MLTTESLRLLGHPPCEVNLWITYRKAADAVLWRDRGRGTFGGGIVFTLLLRLRRSGGATLLSIRFGMMSTTRGWPGPMSHIDGRSA